jgi:DNA-binding PadR family transcriptional regulator
MQQQRQHFQNRLSRPAYLLLASLVQGPKHAVALREAIEQREGVFIEPGTLYRVLAQLEQRGWIEGLDAEGPLRLYRITTLGLFAIERAEASSQADSRCERCLPLPQNRSHVLFSHASRRTNRLGAQICRTLSQGRGKPCPYYTRISWLLLYTVGSPWKRAKGLASGAGAPVPPPLAGPYLFG